MKLITVTLNPAMDKTVYLSKLEQGGCNRIQSKVMDAGGKGINVSKTLSALGENPVSVALVGGHTGQELRKQVEESGMEAVFLPIRGETRTNIKIVEENGKVTELNEPGPEVEKQEVFKLLSYLQECADEKTLFILSGSLPKGVPSDFYKTIIEQVKKKGARVLLDTSGAALSEGLKAGPDIIKPNIEELQEYLNLSQMSKKQVFQEGKNLLSEKVQLAVVSMGEKGAAFLTKKECLFAKSPAVEVHSTVGAGDALVAALAYGISQGMSLREIAKLSIAVSAGAVMTYGTKPAEKSIVEALLNKVEIEVSDLFFRQNV